MTQSSDSDISQFVSQQTDEWATPPAFLRPIARAVGGFDLDPCSGAESSPVADSVYTESENGLEQPWFGDIWVNPPYSEMDAWTAKVVSESNRPETDVIVYLCKGDSSTNWWHYGVSEASAVAMLDGRLSFGAGDSSAPFASHVFIYGDPPARLLDTFERRGIVFHTDQRHQRAPQSTLADCHTDTDQEGDADE